MVIRTGDLTIILIRSEDMRVKTCTYPEQSQKMIDMGIDIWTHDMAYRKICGTLGEEIEPGYAYTHIGKLFETREFPAWSLDALMRMMPTIEYNGHEYQALCYYRNGKGIVNYENIHEVRPFVSTSAEHLVDAAFDMIVWLVEEGYIKVNKEQ